jgi:hypothetical protein
MRRQPSRPIRTAAVLTASTLATGVLSVGLVPATSDAAHAARRPTKVKATFSAVQAVSGASVVVTGKVRDRGRRKRVVILEQRIKSGWRKVDKAKTSKRGEFALNVPTHWFYSTKMRVRTPRARRSPGDASRAVRMQVVPGYAPLGSRDSWAHSSKDKIRANPCQKISYGINSAGALPDPASAAAAIHHSVALVAQATGMRFKFTGETSAVPFDKKQRKTDPKLVFGWVRDEDTPLDLGPAVAARGGSDKARWARDARGRRVGEAVTMGVIYDAGEPYMTAADMYHLTMHELGHAVGLGHVGATDQHMSTGQEGYYLPTSYSAGDLNGLAHVGLQQGCLRPFRGGRGRYVASLVVPTPLS